MTSTLVDRVSAGRGPSLFTLLTGAPPVPFACMQIFWFFPTHGDGHFLGTTIGGRAVTPAYLRQIAMAIDELGFAGALLPTGKACEDAWIVAAMLAAETRRLRFLVALRPGLIAPALAVRMAATLDRVSNGRLLLNIVTGGDPVELAGDGVHLDHDARYAVTEEFLNILRRYFTEDAVQFTGEHFRVVNGSLLLPPVQRPHPPIYLGGSSPAGHAVAAQHADVYLRMLEYAALGIETFIFSGYPHLEEAYRVAELLFPRLPVERRPAGDVPSAQHLVGEVVANDRRPQSPRS